MDVLALLYLNLVFVTFRHIKVSSHKILALVIAQLLLKCKVDKGGSEWGGVRSSEWGGVRLE